MHKGNIYKLSLSLHLHQLKAVMVGSRVGTKGQGHSHPWVCRHERGCELTLQMELRFESAKFKMGDCSGL